jgi:hypothetical protein
LCDILVMVITLPPGVKVPSLAERCQVHPASMYRALNDFDEAGVHNCSTDLATAIHRESQALGHLIPCWTLRPDVWAVGQFPPSLERRVAS